ncbi:hypothetical protein DOM21_14715 [Bacteriovorax stolpii]|uniref:methyl-accepting chemotaxis protein n=1 Tax=Bacteriovorax stolpii TaxID=960 RepID=UPI001158A2BF|nr:methyl-accepting chemotaxis protein [Bacteriovorax stolpii]QDK42679.1 hypothetical protein DOM21_14715 [Bacteriovorax stolpii]
MDKYFSSLSIKKRLVIGFIIVPIIMVALSFIGISEVNKIDKALYKINEITSIKQRYAINFRGSVHDRAISLRDIILNNEKSKIQVSKDEIKKLEDFYSEASKNMKALVAKYGLSEEEMKLLQAINTIEEKTMPVVYKTIKAKDADKNEEALSIMLNEAKPLFVDWLKSINNFIDHQEKINTIDANTARNVANGYQRFIIILTVISLLVAFAIGFFVIRSITRPLYKVSEKIEQSSTSISEVSESISADSKSLSEGAISQASSLEQISSSAEELNKIVEHNVDLTNNASKIAIESRDSAKEGELVVNNMMNAIKEIDNSNTQIMNQINESNQQMTEIIKVIQEIGDKTKIINDIVFQTKLLSFNASVEAARAGEHGKGFAVVAEEVGKLAQMSGEAANEISKMLINSSQKVEGIVNNTKEKVSGLIEVGKQKVETGNEVATQCALVLKEIVEKANSVTDMTKEVSISFNEQKEGFSQIATSIMAMDKITQQNSMLAKENASTINQLNQQTVEMKNAYSDLSSLLGKAS